MSTPTTAEPPAGAIVKNAKDIVLELGKLIQAEGSPERLEELLGLCDRLNLLLANMPSARPSKLQLQGLGMKLGNASILNGNGANGNGLFANGNGHATRSESPDQSHDDKENPSPKIDKGKGKAEPEPEQHEPVLSPRHFLVGESEDEDEDEQRYLHENVDIPNPSPIDR
jgi:protein phosphatase 1 regulatory subunit 37